MSIEPKNQYTRISAKDVWKIEGETDWERIRAMSDEDIDAAIADDPDTLDTDEEFWKDATWSLPLISFDQEEES